MGRLGGWRSRGWGGDGKDGGNVVEAAEKVELDAR